MESRIWFIEDCCTATISRIVIPYYEEDQLENGTCFLWFWRSEEKISSSARKSSWLNLASIRIWSSSFWYVMLSRVILRKSNALRQRSWSASITWMSVDSLATTLHLYRVEPDESKCNSSIHTLHFRNCWKENVSTFLYANSVQSGSCPINESTNRTNELPAESLRIEDNGVLGIKVGSIKDMYENRPWSLLSFSYELRRVQHLILKVFRGLPVVQIFPDSYLYKTSASDHKLAGLDKGSTKICFMQL